MQTTNNDKIFRFHIYIEFYTLNIKCLHSTATHIDVFEYGIMSAQHRRISASMQK